jgi:hypothetical protein
MDAEEPNQSSDAAIVTTVSQLIFQSALRDRHCKKIDELKSVDGIAALYVIHKSGKPFPQCAYVTPQGTVLRFGLTADDFHTIISHIEFSEEMVDIETSDDIGIPLTFSMVVPVTHIKESCYTRAKRLAAEVPEDQTERLMCEPLRVAAGMQMPVIATDEMSRIMQWAQEHHLFGELKEKDLVSLHAFAKMDGKKIYPTGIIQ